MYSFEEGVSFVRKHIPGFEVRYKNENFVSKLIGVLVWPFCRRYMKDFTSTRFGKVYFPSREYVRENQSVAFKILMHEFVHLWDEKEKGWRFRIDYLLPQLYGPVNILFAIVWFLVVTEPAWARWTFGSLGLVVGIAMFFPWPSGGRCNAEVRGYAMNLALNYWKYGSIRSSTILWIVDKFTGWDYYKMAWHEDEVRGWFRSARIRIEAGLFGPCSICGENGAPYNLVKHMLDKSKVE